MVQDLSIYAQILLNIYIFCCMASGGGFTIYPEILHYAQWLCLSSVFSTVRDAGCEPGTTGSVAELGVRLQNNIASRACASFSRGVASRAIAYF